MDLTARHPIWLWWTERREMAGTHCADTQLYHSPFVPRFSQVEANGGEGAFPRLNLRAQYTHSRACLRSIFHNGWTIAHSPVLDFESSNTSLSWVWLTYSDCENHDPLLILILIKKKNEFLGQYMSVQTKLPAIGIIITAEDCQFMKSLTLNILLMSFI